ncbi:uncharacterized protein [Triticum aestivum]|uniref:uncharacterized protein n=1 Tax=Triticum aestivum TaxID=4565 RepID=UPI001D035683|nr:uncharacterized protein LOC123138939 [Triticum aestivum]
MVVEKSHLYQWAVGWENIYQTVGCPREAPSIFLPFRSKSPNLSNPRPLSTSAAATLELSPRRHARDLQPDACCPTGRDAAPSPSPSILHAIHRRPHYILPPPCARLPSTGRCSLRRDVLEHPRLSGSDISTLASASSGNDIITGTCKRGRRTMKLTVCVNWIFFVFFNGD